MEKQNWNRLSMAHTKAIGAWYEIGQLIVASNDKEENDILLEAKASLNTSMNLMEKVLYGAEVSE
jgi:hypothetical protein